MVYCRGNFIFQLCAFALNSAILIIGCSNIIIFATIVLDRSIYFFLRLLILLVLDQRDIGREAQ